MAEAGGATGHTHVNGRAASLDKGTHGARPPCLSRSARVGENC